ncbi:MAG: hypothetical protein ACLQPD_00835 [Desulfomonilaceae bacterium]
MKLAVTIDVEEEGLFRGKYDSSNVSVTNVLQLRRLDSIFLEWQIRPTLLVTYPVVNNEKTISLLLELKEKWNAEIGAHLHPWNTPPIATLSHPEPVPSEFIPSHLLKAKLETLLTSLSKRGVEPVSFRMGRFNMGPTMFSVLQETDIEVDSSIAPMQRYYGGPDHLIAPTDPYFPDPVDPRCPGSSNLLEVPLTTVPLTRNLGRYLQSMDKSIIPGSWISWAAMYLGTLSVQPLGTGLKRMKMAVLLHSKRGGEVLTLFFHSSELMAGGSPELPTTDHVNWFFNQLRSFIRWLRLYMNAEPVTLSQLGESYRSNRQ